MILDNETLFADQAAFGDTPVTLDLGAVRPGPGKALKCFFTTHTVLTGATGIQLNDAAVLPADEALELIEGIPGVGETIEFSVPSTCLQFLTMALGGTASAGTYSAGIVMDVQTNT